MKTIRFLLLALLGSCGVAQAAAMDDAACEKLAALKLEHGEIVSAEVVSSGPRMFKMMLFGGIPWVSLPESCRVAGIARPSADSEIRFEVWMPTSGWNGKFQGLGGGGLDGVIPYMQMSQALIKGYATAATDSGHQGTMADGVWALNHPEKIIDYGHRSMHEMTVKAKQIVTAYYGKPATRHYFSGCSNGGREAMREAQLYPQDYDGIVVGAPALDSTAILPTWGWNQQMIRAVPDGMELGNKLEAVEAAVIAQCDALDGVKDGVIDDPRRCGFKPASIACKAGEDHDECLTPGQVKVLEQLYAGPGPYAGYEHPGLEPAGQTGAGGWRDLFDHWYGKSGQYNYVHEFLAYLTYHDASWEFSRFDFKKDRLEMRKRLGGIMDATEPNLDAFLARGGKMIIYHGWSDVALPPRGTVNFYEKLSAKLGPVTQDSVRLFMAPGVQHCAMGPGPNAWGQVNYGEGESPENNVHAALEQWVEKGRKPERLIAGKYDSDVGAVFQPGKQKLLRSRPLCPYPQAAKYRGKGSTDDAASFDCVAP